MSPRSTTATPRDHFVTKLLHAERRTEPYEHMVIDEVFPPWYYKRMLAHFPDEEVMVHPYSDTHTYENVRQLDIVPDPVVKHAATGEWSLNYHRSSVGNERWVFWESWRGMFMSPEIVEIISDIWRNLLPLEEGEVRYPVGRLAVDYESAGLGPHIDRTDKRISMVFYLAPIGGHPVPRALGTKLLKLKDPDLEVTDKHYSYDHFDVATVAEYVPNRLIMWPVTPTSFHAYEQTYSGSRKTIKMFIQDRRAIEHGRRRTEETASVAHDWRK